MADHLPRLVACDTAALEHECALAATEIAEDVIHIAEVLCHRSEDVHDVGTTSVRHIEEALSRRGDDGRVDGGSASAGVPHCAVRSGRRSR